MRSNGLAIGSLLLVGGVSALALTLMREPWRPMADPPPPLAEIEVPRLELTEAPGISLDRVDDFAVLGDTLFTVHARSRRVIALRRSSSGAWTFLFEFGRDGDGPGEFRSPTGIAVVRPGPELVVVDGDGTLQYFTVDGRFLQSTRIRGACRFAQPRLAPLADSILTIWGNCLAGGVGGGADTLYAAAFWTADGDTAHQLAREPRLTRDGSWGSAYLALRSVHGVSGSLVFGLGHTACVHEIRVGREGRPVAERICARGIQAFSIRPPPSLPTPPRRSMASGSGGRSSAWEWPDPFTYYFAAVVVDSSLVFVRPMSSDSLLLQVAGGPPVDVRRSALAVAPQASFLGCESGACLWHETGVDGLDRIGMLDHGDLSGLVSSVEQARENRTLP